MKGLMSIVCLIAFIFNNHQTLSYVKFGTFRSSSRVSKRYQIRDTFIDLSPSQSGGVLKRIIHIGDMKRGFPKKKDSVQIQWDIFLMDGTLAHSSKILSESFSFIVGADPREVILGWELAIPTMFEGEKAELIMTPEFAFGENGVPPMIPPKADVRCEIELVKIFPYLTRQYKSVGQNESIREELLESIERKTSPIVEEVSHNVPINETKSDENRKYFDPATMKEDPDQLVSGEGKGHYWTESHTSMEVEIPLITDSNLLSYYENKQFTKGDLNIKLSSTEISIRLTTGEIIFEGPLFNKIIPSESGWALLERDAGAKYRGQRVQLSLEKAFGARNIWTSFLSRDFLLENSTFNPPE
eukprot:gene3047-5967_t